MSILRRSLLEASYRIRINTCDHRLTKNIPTESGVCVISLLLLYPLVYATTAIILQPNSIKVDRFFVSLAEFYPFTSINYLAPARAGEPCC